MNTPTNNRYSSSSEYATPGSVDNSENSLYFSFTDDDDFSNKENSFNKDSRAKTDHKLTAGTTSCGSKAKTPLLRRVLQSSLTPRKPPKQVSFKDTIAYELQMPLNSNVMHEQEPIEGTKQNSTNATSREQMRSNSSEHNANSETDADADNDDDMQNTIIENPSLSNASGLTEQSNNTNDIREVSSTASRKNGKLSQNIGNSETVETKVSDPAKKSTESEQTRNVTKNERKQLVRDSRKNTLPVAKKFTRATTYKRRSSTYEPRKIDPRKSLGVLKQVAQKLSKSISGI